MKKLFTLFLLLLPVIGYAFQPLPADQAFAVTPAVKNNNIVAFTWVITPGYHLYRDRINFNVKEAGKAQLGKVVLPPGIPKEDDILGDYEIYENHLAVDVPLLHVDKGLINLNVNYQGCADSGFCYPPTTKTFSFKNTGTALSLVKITDVAKKADAGSDHTAVKPASLAEQPPPAMSEQDKITHLLAGNNWFLILLAFFGFGILLAFTPCVLPMIPILSGIIVGQGKSLTTIKAFFLSLTYVLAMAFTYAAAGVLAGLAGSYLQAFLQSSLVIGIFSIFFVLLAFSLFGFYELRMPAFLHHHVTHLSNKQSGGTYAGVAVMGVLATLIVSPCVTAPLIGVLSYIGKTGNAVLGGCALFVMGLGAGIPLLIVGTTEGKFLPKAGEWMNAVKVFFGVLLLAAAIWLLQRILLPSITMVLWAGLLIISSVYMGAFTHTPASGWGKLWKGSSLILLVYGFLLLIGAAMGNTNPLQPLSIHRAIPVTTMMEAPPILTVHSLKEVQQALVDAKDAGKPVMLDFYADWCIACKQMDQYTFNVPRVQNKLSHFVLLRADVTANDSDNQELEKHFGVIAPPTILFFNENGDELRSQRIVGEMDAKEFLSHVTDVMGQCRSEFANKP